jgi:sugar lactone lactonase YvrE
VAVDSAGNLFIADSADHRVRKIALDGSISTVAGDGFPGFRAGGLASAARLNTPYGIVVDNGGTLYIADLGNNRIRQVSPDGAITTVPGTESLLAPRNVAVDAAGTLHISEFGGARVWRIRAGGVLETVAGTGTSGFAGDGGPASAAQLSYPAGLAFDAAGNLYIADSSNHRIRKIAGGVITTVLGTGVPGADLPAQLNLPTSVVVDRTGNLYVSDSGNQRVQQLTVAGTINSLPGAGRDLALDRGSNLFIASGTQVIELPPSLAIQTVAGDGSYQFRGDGGAATAARLNGPVAMALSSSGELLIADQKNSRVRIVNPAGIISTAAGDGTPGSGGELSFPSGVAVGDSGTVYVSDQNNDRIQELTPGGAATTLAGTGVPGFNGDGLPATATQLFSPRWITLAGDGRIYFVDAGNGRVRELHPGGTISTVARMTAGGVAADTSGNVYISDVTLHRVVRVDPSGLVSVIAGTGGAGFAGDGGPATSAQLNSPGGLAIDKQGNIYIADMGNHRIRMVRLDAVIATIAGTGIPDFAGDGGPGLSAGLNSPGGLALDNLGNLYVADTGNNRVRMLTPVPVASQQTEPFGIVNAASMAAGPVAAGEIVSIFGAGIGPMTAAQGTLDSSGVLATEISGTRVLFDGFAAPLSYVQDTQVNTQVPYERRARVGGVIRKGTCGGRAVTANSKSYKPRK